MAQETSPLPVWQASIAGTPLGVVTCAATQNGLTAVRFTGPDAALQAALQAAVTAADTTAHTETDAPPAVAALLEEALGQISAYLNGERRDFDLPFDLSGCTDFQRRVLAEVCAIPYGATITYGQIAARVGGMQTVRAVGQAVGSNPLPLVIPCHRVMSEGGHLRGYSGSGGVQTKAWLLRLEGNLLLA